MVKIRRAYYKTCLKLFRKEWVRFLLLVGVNLVGVGVMSGLGPICDTLKQSFSEKMASANAPDLIGMCSSEEGYTDELMEQIRSVDGVEEANAYITLPYGDGRYYFQYYCYDDYSAIDQAKPTLLEGRFPENEYEIAVEAPGNSLDTYKIGDTVRVEYETSVVTSGTLPGFDVEIPFNIVTGSSHDYTVVGIVESAMYSNKTQYPSLLDPDSNMSGIYYMHSSFKEMDVNITITLPVIGDIVISKTTATLPYNAVSINITGIEGANIYESDYLDRVDALKAELSDLLGEDTTFLTLQENAGVVSLGEYADKVMALSYIVSAFFIVIVILVITTTLARLVEEERPIIACYRSNGVGSGHIAMKYALFAILSITIGAVLGYLLMGEWLIYFIYSAFSTSYYMPPMTGVKFMAFGIVATLITVGAALVATILVLIKSLRESPANLLLPKAPTPGKKILLERIGPIWRRLSFSFKSMFRNVFRHPIRSVLTIVSVIGSTALLFAGWGVVCASSFGDLPPGSEMVGVIGGVIVLVAAALCLLVLTNIMNIQVGEKTREIATLEVLGYTDKEVAMYIYREVDFLVIISTLCGLPCGYGFTLFVFGYVGLGSSEDIMWWVYFLIIAIEMIMMCLSNLMLYPKIRRIDMNASLKAIE